MISRWRSEEKFVDNGHAYSNRGWYQPIGPCSEKENLQYTDNLNIENQVYSSCKHQKSKTTAAPRIYQYV